MRNKLLREKMMKKRFNQKLVERPDNRYQDHEDKNRSRVGFYRKALLFFLAFIVVGSVVGVMIERFFH